MEFIIAGLAIVAAFLAVFFYRSHIKHSHAQPAADTQRSEPVNDTPADPGGQPDDVQTDPRIVAAVLAVLVFMSEKQGSQFIVRRIRRVYSRP